MTLLRGAIRRREKCSILTVLNLYRPDHSSELDNYSGPNGWLSDMQGRYYMAIAGLDQIVPILQSNSAVLRIYSRQKPSLQNDHSVEYAECLPAKRRCSRAVKNECDAVILAYQFHATMHQDLYRTHFASKLPEYLGLGMPVIIAGPPDATGVAWGLENPTAAVTICNLNEENWKRPINRLIRDAEFRESLAREAVSIGNQYFDPTKIERNFRELIMGCIS